MYKNFHKRITHHYSQEWNGGSSVYEIETVEIELRAFLSYMVEIQESIENAKHQDEIKSCVFMFDTMLNKLGIDSDYVKTIKRNIENNG